MSFTEQLADLNKKNPGYFRINDIEMDIPPQSIVISTEEYDNSYYTIRDAAPTTRKTGRKRTTIIVNLVFDITSQPIMNGEIGVEKGRYRGWNDLSRLLIQTRKSPIASIENEKIRTELMGGYYDSVSKNGSKRFQYPTTIGTVIDAIQGEVDSENPSLIRVTLRMTHFNYLPYTYNLLYREPVTATYTGPGLASSYDKPARLPGVNYEIFYKSGTLDALGNLVNDPSSQYSTQTDIANFEIIYKEYDTIASGKYVKYADEQKDNLLVPSSQPDQNSDSKLHSAKKYSLSHAKYRKTKRYEDGWIMAAKGELGEKEDMVLYRYTRVEIPASNIQGQDGELLLQNISFGINTNVAYIPMEKYSMPTAQFLGGSRAAVRAIIYATPEREVRGNQTKMPVATSKKLGQLQRILDQVNENKVKYSKYAQDDHLLVGHPITKLLKYERYIPTRSASQPIKVTDFGSNNLQNLNFDNYFSCIVSSRMSSTVDGIPFASQLQMDLKEQRINHKQQSLRPLTGKDGNLSRTTVFDAVKEIFRYMSDKYMLRIEPIKHSPKENASIEPLGRVVIGAIVTEPDKKFLDKFIEYVEGSLYIRPYKDIQEMFDDQEIFNSPVEDAIKIALKERGIGENVGYEDVEFPDKNGKMQTTSVQVVNLEGERASSPSIFESSETRTSRFAVYKARRAVIRHLKSKGFCSYKNVGQLLTTLLVEANKNSFSWGKHYLEKAQALNSNDDLPADSAYPDLLLPNDVLSPTFYLDEDSYLRNKQADFMDPMLKYFTRDSERALINYFHSKTATSTIAKSHNENLSESLLTKAGNLWDGTDSIWASDGGQSISRNAEKEELGDPEETGKVLGIHSSHTHYDRDFLAVQASVGLQGVEKGMSKSMPAYKIVLMEDSALFETRGVTDDKDNILSTFKDLSTYFDLSSIIDIRISKKEDNPVDLLVIRVAANSRDKVNVPAEDISHDEIMDSIRKPKKWNQITKMEERFSERGIREGTRIQARLGHTANPNDIPIEFNGKIANVEGKDIITIVAVGNGIELVQTPKNTLQADAYTFNSNTGNLIREVLRDSPELSSFGELDPSFFGYTMTFLPGYLAGRTVTDNIFAPDLFTSVLRGQGLGTGFGEWSWQVADQALDTIQYAHTANFMLKGMGRLAGKKSLDTTINTGIVTGTKKLGSKVVGSQLVKSFGKSALSKSTLVKYGSKIFAKSMTPVLASFAVKGVVGGLGKLAGGPIGWLWLAYDIVSAVSASIKLALVGSRFHIKNMTIWDILQELTLRHPGTICSVVPYGKRNTIFFGEPHQFYNYRPLTREEAGLVPDTRFDKFFLEGETTTKAEEISNMLDVNPAEKGNVARDGEITSKQRGLKRDSEFKKTIGSPLTASESLMAVREPFRKYHFVTSEKDIIKNGIGTTSRGIKNAVRVAFPEDSDEANVDGTVGYEDYDITEEMTADDNIEREHIHSATYPFHNAHREAVKDLPERYAKALLCKNLEKTYVGKLVILGRPNIKPHDVVMLYDTYNDIYGPVGVREVVQVVDRQRGWITEIKPKLMVFPDNSAGLMQLNTIKKLTNYLSISDQEMFYTNVKRFMPNDFSHDSAIPARNITAITEQIYTNITGKDKLISDDLQNEMVEHSVKTGVALKGAVTVGLYGTQAAAVAGIKKNALIASMSDVAELEFNKGALNQGEYVAKQTKNLDGVFNRQEAFNRLARKNVVKDGATQIVFKNGKYIPKTVGKLRAGSLLAQRAVKTAARVAMPFAALLSALALDSIFEGIVSWAKYRQPIMFHPLTRNGQPWYGGMRGYKDNTIVESIEENFTRWGNVAEFNKQQLYNYFERVF